METFSDFALNYQSGCTRFAAIEGLEGSQILYNLLEQLKYEKGSVGACPVRIWAEGDKEGINNTLFRECIVEDQDDGVNNENRTYQDFLLNIHQKIRANIAN
jgi:hypothetical protein